MTDATDIRQLDEDTVSRIAAGEVIERPASVVKELIENSLDADADRVEVAVERGGKDLVRVRDDGVGMTDEAVRTAVRQHTTSKIRDAGDLDGVATLGFRGEALHTIGAVSRLTIRTKPRGGDRGTELRMEGGDVVAVEPTGCPEGTTVEVTDLFYNTPAREKYLKQDRTEFARVNDVVTRYALANPDVAVSLEHDGREVFATTGQGDLRAAILAVYGREVAEEMIPVEADLPDDAAPLDGDALADGPLDGIAGFVSHPETTRSSRDYVSTFVNGRWVRSGAAREAVVEAYGNQLAADRYPFAVLFLDVPADAVDVNVHPRKMEVRFADETGLREQVETAVHEALLDHGLLRSSAPRGRSAPDEAEVRPAASEADEKRPDESTGATTGESGVAGASADSPVGDASAGSSPGRASTGPSSRGSSDDSSSGGAADRSPAGDASGGSTAGGATRRVAPEDRTAGSASGGSTDGSTPRSAAHGPEPDRKFVAGEQRTLDGEPVSTDRTYEQLPRLRVLGQYDDTYVVAAAPDGLVVIDQHAADERVNYERLREQFADEVTTQALADPVELELTAGEAAAFEDSREALARLGFSATRTGDRTVAVRTVPAVLADALDPELLRDVLARAMDGESGDESVEARADDLLADLACYPSVTGNTSLSEGSVLDLLAALDDCENPYACPHGRPVLIHVDDDELDERFERDYPGHAGRRE